MRELIEQRIQKAFKVDMLKVVDESSKHEGHLGGGEIESHFRVGLVSDDFADKSRVDRQRMVYELFKEELKSGKIHMLSLNIKTNEEIGK